MGILDIFKRKAPETRAIGPGFTAEVLNAREAYISGTRGIGELTAAVQSCVSLWETGCRWPMFGHHVTRPAQSGDGR